MKLKNVSARLFKSRGCREHLPRARGRDPQAGRQGCHHRPKAKAAVKNFFHRDGGSSQLVEAETSAERLREALHAQGML